MSAFIVEATHIDVLIDVAKQFAAAPYKRLRWYYGNPLHMTTIDEIEETEFGRLLLTENAASVSDRYRELPYPAALTYAYRPTRRFFTPAQALKAIDCYEYQSSEHSGWEQSQARAFARALFRQVVDLTIVQREEDPWDWTDTALGRDAELKASCTS